MGAWVRVKGGIEKGQWGHWSGRVNGDVSVNGGIEKGQSALVRVNGGIEKGQRGHWSGSMGAWRRVRSDRGSGLQAPPCRVVR